tara:strand:+ start:430 stop:591 length:162 start_codon:yes stop_codon:yes gene_type:complete
LSGAQGVVFGRSEWLMEAVLNCVLIGYRLLLIVLQGRPPVKPWAAFFKLCCQL